MKFISLTIVTLAFSSCSPSEAARAANTAKAFADAACLGAFDELEEAVSPKVAREYCENEEHLGDFLACAENPECLEAAKKKAVALAGLLGS